MRRPRNPGLEAAASRLFFVWIVIGIAMYFIFGRDDLGIFFMSIEGFTILTLIMILVKYKYFGEQESSSNALGYLMMTIGVLIIFLGVFINFFLSQSTLSEFYLQILLGITISIVGYGSLVRHETKEDLMNEEVF